MFKSQQQPQKIKYYSTEYCSWCKKLYELSMSEKPTYSEKSKVWATNKYICSECYYNTHKKVLSERLLMEEEDVAI